jgi:hypothetical protein
MKYLVICGFPWHARAAVSSAMYLHSCTEADDDPGHLKLCEADFSKVTV